MVRLIHSSNPSMMFYFLTLFLILRSILNPVIAQSNNKGGSSISHDESIEELKERIRNIGIEVNGKHFDATGVVGDDNNGFNGLDLGLSDEDSELVHELLQKVKKDPDTLTLVSKLKTVQGPSLDAMKNGMSATEKVKQLKNIVSEMQALETLFQDPVRALKMMNEDGMVPKEKLPLYEKNPQLLEDDTRKGLYFSFITMSMVLELL
jgi:hypothetical protein